jgi:hypothetical protein
MNDNLSNKLFLNKNEKDRIESCGMDNWLISISMASLQFFILPTFYVFFLSLLSIIDHFKVHDEIVAQKIREIILFLMTCETKHRSIHKISIDDNICECGNRCSDDRTNFLSFSFSQHP